MRCLIGVFIVIVFEAIYAPFLSANCEGSGQWIGNQYFYDQPCACESLSYPMIDATLIQFGARVRSVSGPPQIDEEKPIYRCGISLEWKERPNNPTDCYKNSIAAREAFDKDYKQLQESERPEVLGSRDLPCSGYDSTNDDPALVAAVDELQKNEKSKQALTTLLDETKDENVWQAAWDTLKTNSEPLSRISVRSLADELHGDSPAKRKNAAFVLGLLGRDAREAVPDLLVAVNDQNTEVKTMALVALGRTKDPAVEGVIERRLADPNLLVMTAACNAIEALGAAGEPAVAQLIDIDRNNKLPGPVRDSAKLALRAIGSPEALLALSADDKGNR